MKEQLKHLAFEVELQPGERLSIPPSLIERVGPGRWVVTIEPAEEDGTRNYSAFLNGYAAEDEGLYDDYPGR